MSCCDDVSYELETSNTCLHFYGIVVRIVLLRHNVFKTE